MVKQLRYLYLSIFRECARLYIFFQPPNDPCMYIEQMLWITFSFFEIGIREISIFRVYDNFVW